MARLNPQIAAIIDQMRNEKRIVESQGGSLEEAYLTSCDECVEQIRAERRVVRETLGNGEAPPLLRRSRERLIYIFAERIKLYRRMKKLYLRMNRLPKQSRGYITAKKRGMRLWLKAEELREECAAIYNKLYDEAGRPGDSPVPSLGGPHLFSVKEWQPVLDAISREGGLDG